MAGSEQRPSDDVEGHGRNYQDTEAVDDRGSRLPDDVEGHIKRIGQDTEAVDEDRGKRFPDDTEGHAYRLKQDPETGDDTKGHAYKWGQDTEAVDEDQADDDTQGHIRKY
jgi:hypothetical protein